MLKNRRVWLGALLAWLCLYHGTIAYSVMDDLRHGQSRPGLPLNFGFRMKAISDLTSDAVDAGVRFGDILETIDGKPFSNMRILYDAVNIRQPGDLLPVTVRSPKGTAFAANIRVPSRSARPASLLEWIG